MSRPRLSVGALVRAAQCPRDMGRHEVAFHIAGTTRLSKTRAKEGRPEPPELGRMRFDLFGDGAVIVLPVAVAFWEGYHIDVGEHIVTDAD